MNPAKVIRKNVAQFTDLPNVGAATAADLRVLGFHSPADLIGQDPYSMYNRLCEITRVRHDPCVIDVFLSITHFMDGGRAKSWWSFTDQRKAFLKKRQR